MRSGGEIWIDGFNLFHRWEATRASFAQAGDLDAALGGAMTRLARFLGGRARRAVVFLDGGRTRENGVHGGVLRYKLPGPRRRADDLMVETLRGRAGRGAKVTAVTDDRELGARLADLGARLTRVDDFLSAAAASGRAGAGAGAKGRARASRDRRRIDGPSRDYCLSPAEVAAWLAYFGGESGEGGAAASERV